MTLDAETKKANHAKAQRKASLDYYYRQREANTEQFISKKYNACIKYLQTLTEEKQTRYLERLRYRDPQKREAIIQKLTEMNMETI